MLRGGPAFLAESASGQLRLQLMSSLLFQHRPSTVCLIRMCCSATGTLLQLVHIACSAVCTPLTVSYCDVACMRQFARLLGTIMVVQLHAMFTRFNIDTPYHHILTHIAFSRVGHYDS